jgi:hypothetical protein
MSSPILIDGIASDGRIEVTDSPVLRGDGAKRFAQRRG